MLLLALDSATPAVTAAVHDGERVLAEVTHVDGRRHGELVAPSVEQVLREAGVERTDLTDVVVGRGPGPFTGLRVGLVTARVLAAALGLRLHGVCTLDAIAAAVVADGVLTGAAGSGASGASAAVEGGAVRDRFVVATDARRREVHWAGYAVTPGEPGGFTRVDGPAVSAPADVPVAGRPVVGRGARLYADVLGDPVGPDDPSAGALASYAVAVLAAGGDLSATDPLYLRRPDATPPAARKRVLS